MSPTLRDSVRRGFRFAWAGAVLLAILVSGGVGAGAQLANPSDPPDPAQTPNGKPPAERENKQDSPVQHEGSMTLARMGEIIKRLDDKAEILRPGTWQFTVSERVVVVITDSAHNRMRILSPIGAVDGLPVDLLKRLMQANFDTALDARYAVAKGVLWSTFIHPLSALHDRQFISGIGQTVNLVLTFGSTFSSGAMSFGGGDSRDIIRKKLIEELLKKGLPI
ncbi:MAG: type III secretion system chaperone [Hyphomicrobiaceae bacterium]